MAFASWFEEIMVEELLSEAGQPGALGRAEDVAEAGEVAERFRATHARGQGQECAIPLR